MFPTPCRITAQQPVVPVILKPLRYFRLLISALRYLSADPANTNRSHSRYSRTMVFMLLQITIGAVTQLMRIRCERGPLAYLMFTEGSSMPQTGIVRPT